MKQQVFDIRKGKVDLDKRTNIYNQPVGGYYKSQEIKPSFFNFSLLWLREGKQ